MAATLGALPAGAASVAADADKELAAGHFQAACQLYRLALATHRSDATILINASRAYEGAGDLDEAIRRAREAASFEPNNADAHLALGHCLDMNRESKAAILQFEVVLDIKNADLATHKAAYGPILRLLKHETEWDNLAKMARRGAREFPQDPDSHFNAGWALAQIPQASRMETKDFQKIQQEAISEYRKSIALGEKRPAVHLNLAMLLADTGDIAHARQELDNYVKLAPDEANRAEVKALNVKIGN
ncbi:MAG: tetratricopeptide repeat protein [Cyanobacteria bacterium SZAS-4]|nr:tetratricopeptide repeat protein [Cyanobacteria bacterium SZAS-4]